MKVLQTFGFLLFIEIASLLPHIDKTDETKFIGLFSIMMMTTFFTIICSDK